MFINQREITTYRLSPLIKLRSVTTSAFSLAPRDYNRVARRQLVQILIIIAIWRLKAIAKVDNSGIMSVQLNLPNPDRFSIRYGIQKPIKDIDPVLWAYLDRSYLETSMGSASCHPEAGFIFMEYDEEQLRYTRKTAFQEGFWAGLMLGLLLFPVIVWFINTFK